ncbi:MAG TPA: FHA domain-containing protein [Glaciibacter sp.]|nr:FHA domain-containing protein [Glaciibacter sp.]
MNEGRVARATRAGHSSEWLFVVGHAFVAAVPTGTAASVVGELAALATAEQVELESVVSVIPLGGDSAVDSFVVVVPENRTADSHDGNPDGIPVSVVIRGEIAADIYSVGGYRRFTDRGIRPWLLADFRSVVGVAIGSPRFTAVGPGDLRGGEMLAVGTAHGDSLFWSSVPPEAQHVQHRAGPSEQEQPGEREQPGEPERQQTDHQADRSKPDQATDVNDTILRPRARLDDTIIRRPSAGVDRDAGSVAVTGDDAVHGATVLRPTAGASPTDRSTQPLDPLALDPVPAAAPRYGFRVSGGEERRLDAVYYLGRRPVAPRIPTDRVPLLLTVASRTSAVSSTHLEIRQVGDAVVVTDLGSTNGTVVHWPRGKKERLRGGQSLAVMPGTTVDIGDGNIIEILPVSGR